MVTKVVDASALAALLFGEPQGEEVAAALGSSYLLGPTLLRYEIGSVCLKKIWLHPERRQALLLALDLMARLEIREVDVPSREAVALAELTGLTVYDSSYLWLARELGAQLVTLDVELRRVAGERPRSTRPLRG